MAKTKTKAKPKLELSRVLSNLDAKNRNFYDELTDEERSGFSPFLLIRYASSVESAQPLLAEYVLRATNHRANRHFLDLKNHPKLQWLLLTTTSPGFGAMRHNWIKPMGGKKNINDKIKALLLEDFPGLNSQELDILTTINSKQDIIDYVNSTGRQDSDIDFLD